MPMRWWRIISAVPKRLKNEDFITYGFAQDVIPNEVRNP